MADISKITLPDNTELNIKDSTARQNAATVATALLQKLNIAQGIANVGKILGIGNDGKVIPVEAPDVSGKADISDIPTKVSDLDNDAGYLTEHQSLDGKLDTTLKGASGGLAELDANGKVPSSQLPSYVDDVLEYTNQASFPLTGESGKVYIAQDTNITYRWGGSAYVPIGSDLALGETSSTAFRGDHGKAAYDHALAKGSAYTSGLYKITTNAEGHVTEATAVVKSDITSLGIPESDTTYSFDGTYNEATNKAATVSTVNNAIATLDGNLNNTTPGAGKTLTSFSQSDGIVSATFEDISITKSQVSDLGTIGDAAAKSVDASISDSSTSTNLPTSEAVASFVEGKGYITSATDTKNTAGSTDTDSKIFLIGATSQAANPQTYSHDTAYVDTDGCLYSDSAKVLNEKHIRGFVNVNMNGHATKYYMWSDGENLYYTNDDIKYVFDEDTLTWSNSNVADTPYGNDVWTDGENVYYSPGTGASSEKQYDKANNTWVTKTWNVLSSVFGRNIWYDGEDVYYSGANNTNYKLNKAYSAWIPVTFTGMTDLTTANKYTWTDGENLYFSNGTNQRVLNRSTNEWATKTWTGLTNFSGEHIWTDGKNTYYSQNTTHYILDKSTSTWTQVSWDGLSSFNGSSVWNWHGKTYYSVNNPNLDYVLYGIEDEILLGTKDKWTPFSVSKFANDMISNYGIVTEESASIEETQAIIDEYVEVTV